YLFYVDLDCDASDPKAAGALEKVRELCLEFRLLGSYDIAAPRGEAPPRPERKERTEPAAPPAKAELPSSAKNWPKAARPTKPNGTVVRIRELAIGGDEFI